MKSKALKDLMLEADRLWSQAVHKLYHDRCAYSGMYGTDPHHVFKRKHKATRWNVDNGILLSRTIHRRVEDGDKNLIEWIRIFKGSQYRHLEAKHKEIFQPTIAKMEKIIKELENKI